MSVTLYVSCKKSALPTREAWQAALKKAGFDLVLDAFEWKSQSGFLGARYKGEKSGFECMVEDAKPVAKQLGVKLPEGNDVVVSFIFGSDVNESHAATATRGGPPAAYAPVLPAGLLRGEVRHSLRLLALRSAAAGNAASA